MSEEKCSEVMFQFSMDTPPEYIINSAVSNFIPEKFKRQLCQILK
jgi:hypothetical protein